MAALTDKNQLTERQKLILSLVVHDYTETATPVGSKNLVTRYKLDSSPATVRNELAALTEMGLLYQPHTSAGRVPTEDGFRYFVQQHLQRSHELPESIRQTISHQFYQMQYDVDQSMRLAASVLAVHSQGASLVTAPHFEQSRFKHLELISTQGRQVLMVLVTVSGQIHQRIVLLDEPVSQSRLSAAAKRLTEIFAGESLETIQAAIPNLTELEQDAIKWAVEDLSKSDALASGEVYLDGWTNVLSEPEFANAEEARRALHFLEERSHLQDLLARTVLTGAVGGVHVLIGGEGTWDELRQCSLVLGRYGAPGLATGTLGVLGPIRMPYGHTISTVRFLSSLLSDMVVETLSA
jgi:heat-inducible transcriptional repressor